MRTADLPQDLQQSQAPAAQRLRGWVASLSEPVPLKYVLSGAALLLIITLQVRVRHVSAPVAASARQQLYIGVLHTRTLRLLLQLLCERQHILISQSPYLAFETSCYFYVWQSLGRR